MMGEVESEYHLETLYEMRRVSSKGFRGLGGKAFDEFYKLGIVVCQPITVFVRIGNDLIVGE